MKSSTRSSAPTVSAHCSTMASVQLALDGRGRAADLAHDAIAAHPHPLEVHGGEAPHEVDRLDRLDVHARAPTPAPGTA